MSENTVRLAKRIAEDFQCSRADATHYIEGGWVSVDGEIVEEPGFRVTQLAKLVLLPNAVAIPSPPTTILLHKPAGISCEAVAMQLITAAKQSADDRSGIRFLKRHLLNLAIPTPLDAAASGLLVLTQDWPVLRKLQDDALRIEHEIIVDVSRPAGTPAMGNLDAVNRGLTYQGKVLPPMKVSWQNEGRLRFAVKAPPAGMIAHVCGKLNLTVLAERRIRLGRLSMAGLKVGEWRYLQEYERF